MPRKKLRISIPEEGTSPSNKNLTDPSPADGNGNTEEVEFDIQFEKNPKPSKKISKEPNINIVEENQAEDDGDVNLEEFKESMDLETDESEEFEVNQFSWKRVPKSTLLLCILLNVIGFSFVIAGIIQLLRNSIGSGIPFLVFGALVLIPGLFYTFQLVQASKADTKEEQEEILNEIPVQQPKN